MLSRCRVLRGRGVGFKVQGLRFKQGFWFQVLGLRVVQVRVEFQFARSRPWTPT